MAKVKKVKAKTAKVKKKTTRLGKKEAAKTVKKLKPKKVKTTVKKPSIKKTRQKKKPSGLSVPVYNTLGKVVEKMALPKEIFAAKVNPSLMAQAVRVWLVNQRKGTAKTKTRSEVSYSKIKIRPQKGTGRARHGSAGAPIFVGGGVAHGPRPREFELTLPKKMKKRALFSALTEKLGEEKIVVLAGLEKIEPKTKKMAQVLDKLEKSEILKNGQKLLLVLPQKLENLERAARNLEKVNLQKAQNLNTYQVLDSGTLIFLKGSIGKLVEVFLGKVKKS